MALFLVGSLCPGCGTCPAEQPEATTVRVFAAASLSDVLHEMVTSGSAPIGINIQLNLAASSTLARQIEFGAACDIYIAADLQWMDYLQGRQLIDSESRCDLLGNSLVLIASLSAPTLDIQDWQSASASQFGDVRIAIADPELVPAGRYARQAMEHFGLWSDLRDRMLPASDVRAALRLVETGEATYGIVYASDAATAVGAVRVASIPSSSHDPIRYPIALTRSATPAARRLMSWLLTVESAERFRSRGFQPLASTSP